LICRRFAAACCFIKQIPVCKGDKGMSISSTLAKRLPQAVADRGIAKGSHKGDDWATVCDVISTMCEMKHTKNCIEFVYKGKVVGWAKPNGTNWCDDKAYVAMREAYNKRKIAIVSEPVEIENDEPLCLTYDGECYDSDYDNTEE
jgi:hypothetical protein